MSQLIGYICSDDSLTPAAVHAVRDDLRRDQDGDYAAMGFGWVQENRSLLRKHPSQGSNGVSALSLLSDLPARAIVGYKTHEKPESSDTLDLQPFRYRNWVFTQDDTASNFAEYRDSLIESIPDHIRRNVQGNNRAEVAFHLFLAGANERGQLNRQRVEGRQAAAALAETAVTLEQLESDHGDLPLKMQAVSVTSRLLLSARIGDPVFYREFDGIEEPEEEPLFAGHRPKPVEHPHFKGVMVVSGEEPDGDQWTAVDDRSVMWVGHDWEVHTASFDELLVEED